MLVSFASDESKLRFRQKRFKGPANPSSFAHLSLLRPSQKVSQCKNMKKWTEVNSRLFEETFWFEPSEHSMESTLEISPCNANATAVFFILSDANGYAKTFESFHVPQMDEGRGFVIRSCSKAQISSIKITCVNLCRSRSSSLFHILNSEEIQPIQAILNYSKCSNIDSTVCVFKHLLFYNCFKQRFKRLSF